MSYIKSLLPDDWEPKYQSPKKYLCIGTEEVEAQWLPRWYNVLYDECDFATLTDSHWFLDVHPRDYNHIDDLMILHYRPDGDYEEHLKILKTERLLDGTGIHE